MVALSSDVCVSFFSTKALHSSRGTKWQNLSVMRAYLVDNLNKLPSLSCILHYTEFEVYLRKFHI